MIGPLHRWTWVEVSYLRRDLLPDLASFASVDAMLLASEQKVLIPAGTEWRYLPGTNEPPEEWKTLSFDDGDWESGPSGFGSDDEDVTLIDDMAGSYTSLYIRQRFRIPDPNRYPRYTLTVSTDGGFIAYLNGTEVLRVRVPDGKETLPVGGTALPWAPKPLLPWSTVIRGNKWGTRTYTCVLRQSRIDNENVLAIQGFNESLDDSAFSLLPELTSKLEPDAHRDQAVLQAFQEDTKDGAHPALVAYFQGRLRERQGEYGQAADHFAKAMELQVWGPEPVWRLGECLEKLGKPMRTEELLRQALEGPWVNEDHIWRRWAGLCFGDLKLSAEQGLGRLSAVVRRKVTARFARDLIWVLEGLASHETLRINCGMKETYRSPEGQEWSRDRFFRGGHSLRIRGLCLVDCDVSGSREALLYRTARWFPTVRGEDSGYSIPLPPGRYSVTLHFAECWYKQAGKRIFDVLIEESPSLKDYAPFGRGNGFGVARWESQDVTVEDGILDVRFVAKAGNPKISGIEIKALQ